VLDLTNQFLAFCKAKPADEAYEYDDDQSCAFAQFLGAEHPGYKSLGGFSWQDREGADHRIPSELLWPSPAALVANTTFGALTARLEAALSQAAS
jgi:hypothetical protein